MPNMEEEGRNCLLITADFPLPLFVSAGVANVEEAKHDSWGRIDRPAIFIGIPGNEGQKESALPNMRGSRLRNKLSTKVRLL